jgi:ketosteroid isomerase-like protein
MRELISTKWYQFTVRFKSVRRNMRSSQIALLISILLAGTPTYASDVTNSDVSQILSIHESVLRAHLDRDVDALLSSAANDFVLVNRGEVSHPTMQERRARFGKYFGMTVFNEYKDLIPPIVQVSGGGDLAWLVAQVKVSGSQTGSGENRTFQFVSAWIELYEKRDGTWIATGNVSNFRE